jgi:hypothetical protein
MKSRWQRIVSVAVVAVFILLAINLIASRSTFESKALAQATPTPPVSTGFDQKAAVAKLRDQIKGRENEPSDKVYKNIQTLKTIPAGRLLAIMEFGYARSLGVDCTHCHIPDKWESEEKTQKQTARDMLAMMGKINGDLLKSIKNLKSETPTVNCTTCHRGEVKPALNLPAPAKS